MDLDFDQPTVCEKIINEIDAVFHKDPDLCTFDIIPLPAHQNTNKSPIVHEQHHLGLESWCVQHVYEYAHNTILAGARPLAARRQRPQSPTKPAAQSTDQMLKYLNSATLINPDVATYWNLRRKLFSRNQLDIRREFQFTAIVLSKKPKSNEAFFYRRWLFSFQSGESIDWTIELRLSERCADKSASNYHAWCHRQWVLQKAPQLLQFEARITEKFIRKHIGDYSGYNHRQHCLAAILSTGCHEDRHKLQLDDYRALGEYVQLVCGLNAPPQTVDALLELLLPAGDRLAETRSCAQYRQITFLYCLNSAAYDLRLCDELEDMYGSRESFVGHRRAALQFIVTQCRAGVAAGSPVAAKPPVQKVARREGGVAAAGDASVTENGDAEAERRRSDASGSAVVAGIRRTEAERGAQHRKWCALFLGFDYDDGGGGWSAEQEEKAALETCGEKGAV